MSTPILDFLNSITPMSQELQQELSKRLQRKEIKKKEIILEEGAVSNYIYFIETGFLRSYHLKDGVEITNWFMKEMDVIVSVNSFYQRVPSHEFIQVLESCVLHYIHYDDLQYIYKNFVEFNIIGRLVTEKYYILSEERLFNMRKQTAEEKYLHMRDHHADVYQRAALKDIASYLGITLETLSRLRGKK